jgi:putative ABC transport system permease protein
MFRMYLKTAYRNLVKQKYFSLINILGLAFGIAASVLIFLWISHETSFDKFHDNYKNIYRVNGNAFMGGQELNRCSVQSAFAYELADKCPEVLLSTRFMHYFKTVCQYNNNFYNEKKAIMADSNFFKIFSFPFVEGNSQKPFNAQNCVVLTKSTAKKYFGNEKAFGKVLTYNGDPFVVSAVIEDIPTNSHMQFGLAFYSDERQWGNVDWHTYILLKDNFSKSNVNNSLLEMGKFMSTYMAKAFGMTTDQFKNDGNYIDYSMQPLQSIHLESNFDNELEPGGSKTIVIIFSIIAVLILLIAGINYMNLSRAFYDTRRMEVGIRKVNGANSSLLMLQFLFESLLISVAASIVGIILIKLFLPVFNNYINLNINEGIYNNWYFPLLVFALVILLGFISGLYPSAYLSSLNTITILLKKSGTSLNKSFSPRSILVVFQFSVTIIVIIATIITKKQVDFLLNKELGFNKEKLVVIEGANHLGTNVEVFKTELKKNSQIINVSYSDVYPGGTYRSLSWYGVAGYPADQQFLLNTIMADADYFDTYELKMVQGRKFDNTDKPAVILNEKAVELLKLNNPLNSQVIWNKQSYPVLGVVKNFYHDRLNVSLDPILIRYVGNQNLNYITIRISEGDTKNAINFINSTWNKLSGNKPFEFFFLDNKIESAYKSEMNTSVIFLAFTVLSIIIACMGLFGIASFSIQRRIKEVGVRKVNGARVADILAMLNKDFVKWVVIAFVVASPIAYYAMNKWLQSFAYKTEMSWWVFAMAGMLALGIALLTVSWQSWRAATRNPVEALRYE